MADNIAVIGSGMAGLAAAWQARKAGYEVSIFEAHEGRGMDAHTIAWERDGRAAWVDVPLRVMHPRAWSSVIALALEVGVSTFPVDVNVSCSWLDRETWLTSQREQRGGFDFLSIGSWRHFNVKAARIVAGLWKLHRYTRRIEASETSGYEPSLLAALNEADLDPLFTRGLLLPLLATICTCREEHLLQWPARTLLGLLDTVLHRRPLLRLKGGTRALVDGLSEGQHFFSGSPVLSVTPQGDGVLVRNARGEGGLFAKVLVATQANQSSFLQEEAFAREKAVLRQFAFDRGELFIHRDDALLPARRSDWKALNYMMDRRLENTMFSVWVNAVEPSLEGAEPVFQTWNPLSGIDPSRVIARIPMQRAVVDGRTAAALHALQRLHAEEGRQVFFCGSWAAPGVPLLESAVRSAMAVTNYLKPQALGHAVAGPVRSLRGRRSEDQMGRQEVLI